MTTTVGLADNRRNTVADGSGDLVARREAADPETSPWRLAALATHVDAEVRMAVAANASASGLTILRLRRDTDPRVHVVLSACREMDR